MFHNEMQREKLRMPIDFCATMLVGVKQMFYFGQADHHVESNECLAW